MKNYVIEARHPKTGSWHRIDIEPMTEPEAALECVRLRQVLKNVEFRTAPLEIINE